MGYRLMVYFEILMFTSNSSEELHHGVVLNTITEPHILGLMSKVPSPALKATNVFLQPLLPCAFCLTTISCSHALNKDTLCQIQKKSVFDTHLRKSPGENIISFALQKTHSVCQRQNG